MRNPWDTLSIHPPQNSRWSRYWSRRLPELPLRQHADGCALKFWPGPNIGMRTLDRRSIRFLLANLLDSQPFWKRWVYRAAMHGMQAGIVPSPAELHGEIRGDLVIVRESLIEFDLDDRVVHKHYRLPLPRYLVASAEVLRDRIPEVSHSTDGTRVTAPLHAGAPLKAADPLDVRWQRYAQALTQLTRARRDESSTRQVADYTSELSAALPPEFHSPQFRAICDVLRRSGQTVMLTFSHGDLKDENIIVSGERVQLIDWELADIRSALHDLCNLVIHPILKERLSGTAASARWGGRDVLRRLSELAAIMETPVTPEELRICFLLTLVEKLAMYVLSGRWSSSVDQCVRDWESAVKVFDRGLNLEIAA